jgi:type IV secretion system protein VirB5
MNLMKRAASLVAMIGWVAGMVGTAQAQMAVVDVGAIAQLKEQVSYWQQQIAAMEAELSQLQATHAALTGPRGFENLLLISTEARNYLPSSWAEIEQLLAGQSARYGALARALAASIEAVAVLTPEQLAARSPQEREVLESGRSHAAWLAATTRGAYAEASARFASLQQLIAAVGQVTDAKAVADLQARIGAEQTMLANEQAKLELLAQMAQAEAALLTQRQREAVIASHGQFAARFQPVAP